MVTPIYPASSSKAYVTKFLGFLVLFLVFSSYPVVGLILASISNECVDPEANSHPGNFFRSFNDWMIAICSLCIAQKFFWALTAMIIKPFDFTDDEYKRLKFVDSIYTGLVVNYAPTITNCLFFPITFGLWVVGIIATSHYGHQCGQLYPMSIAIFVIMTFDFVILTFIGCIHVFIKACGGVCATG